MRDDVEWVNPPDAIEAGTRRGQSGFEGAESAFGRAYSSIEIEVQKQVESGSSIGLIMEIRFHGRGSGIEVRQRMGAVFTISEGKVERFEWSNDPETLLAGMSGEVSG